MNPLIILNNVFAGYYPNQNILEDINITINENEFLGIIGPNGGGKTTLLKLILGLIKPNRGTVLIDGKIPPNKDCKVGYVPQYSNFDKTYPISVKDAILTAKPNKNYFGSFKKRYDNDLVEKVLTQVDLYDKKNEQIGHLSGGQQQRVLIARALAVNPKILLLDEPTSSIDSRTGQSIYELLAELNKEKTIILVSHDIGAISKSVKKIACLNKSLVYHDSKEITKEMLEATYQCPVDLIAHGVPHRVFDHHH